MINQIDADRIMPAKSAGNLELGTHSVNAGYQYRLLIPFEFKKPAKKSQATQDLRAQCRYSVLFNQLLGSGGIININTGVSVGLLNGSYLSAGNLCLRLPENVVCPQIKKI